MRLLLRKYVHESMLLFLACASMLFLFSWTRVWIMCQFDLQLFEPLLKQFEAFERFSPVPLEQFLTYAGSLSVTFNEPVLILCIVIWSIARGSDVVSGELGRGTLEMLLAQPIRRRTLVLAHAIVGTLGLAMLCLIVWLGLTIGIYTNEVQETVRSTVDLQVPFTSFSVPVPLGEGVQVSVPLQEKISPWLFLPSTVNLFGFGFFLFCLSSLFSCLDRYRWRTLGMTISVYIIQLLVFLFSRAITWARPWENFTFFGLFQPAGIVQLLQKHPEAAWSVISPTRIVGFDCWLGPFGLSLALCLCGVIFLVVGTFCFCRRDLPAPV